MFRMKKIFAILLLIIYTTASAGFSIKQFYCCGKLKSVSFTFSQGTKEKCSKGNEKDGCCQNKYHTLKVKDNHIAADDFARPAQHFADLHISAPFYQSPDFIVLKQINTANPGNAPPLHYGVPVYIFNCTYRI
ncbi:hypothetical protein PV783_17000 [Chitinophaga sp. CC14]|uniref:HYC_CC_PP family protein n=1 Tax=Chitinophaga sp. CC14 TaxID=3029199 RepID=UPI003B800B21